MEQLRPGRVRISETIDRKVESLHGYRFDTAMACDSPYEVIIILPPGNYEKDDSIYRRKLRYGMLYLVPAH